MEPLLNFFKFSILHIFIIASILLLTDARFFSDDEKSISPSEPTNGNPYGLPTPLSPPPQPSLSPALIPPPPATPSVMVPPPPSPNFPIKSPPGSFTPKPSSPPSSAPGPSPPSPTVHLPPSTVPPPPPAAASPPHKKPSFAVWCVAKPTVPDLAIQAALDYACGSGADCKSIQPNGPCFQPNTLVAHASYAFNSYWQNSKEAGGTCDFGGTAMLVTVDPSYNKCSFIFK